MGGWLEAKEVGWGEGECLVWSFVRWVTCRASTREVVGVLFCVVAVVTHPHSRFLFIFLK